MSIFRASFLSLFLALILTACEQDEAPYPSVKIIGQLAGRIQYGDTLRIEFEASPINRYRLHILKGNQIVASSFRVINKENDRYEVEMLFDDRYLEDGAYDLRISVENEDKGNSTFHSFTYDGLDLQWQGFAMLSNQKLVFVNDQGFTEREFLLNTPFDRLKISTKDSLIYLASLGDGGIEVRHLRDFQLLQSFSAPLGANLQSYRDFVKSEEGIYLLQNDGFIRNLEGGSLVANQSFNRQGQSYTARRGASLSEGLACIFAYNDGSSPEVHYLNQNLFSLYSRALSGTRHRLCALDQERLAIVYQKANGQWSIDRFKGSTQDYSVLQSFSADSVFDLHSFAIDEIIYSTNTGLYRYHLNATIAPQFIQSGSFHNFQIRATDQTLFLQKGNLIQALLLNNNLQFAASINEPLLDYEILYNK